MKKKGFTLIELLAVRVILAIIALIATPLVLKYIEKSRTESKVDSAYSFVRNLETEIANYSIKNKGTKYNGQPNDKGYYEISNFENPKIDIKVKGDNPDTIKVCLSSLGQVDKGMFEYGKYYVSYDGKKGSISDKDTYDNFSCSGNGGNVAKVEVPEATKEFNGLMKGHIALVGNNQGILFYDEYTTIPESVENDNNIFNIANSVVNRIKVPSSLFKNSIPTDGNITAIIKCLDGSEKTIELIKNGNNWYYESSENLPFGLSFASFSISFRPNLDIEDDNNHLAHSDDYHIIDISCGDVRYHAFQSITLLGSTIKLNGEVVVGFASMSADGDPALIVENYTKLKKVIVNYKDGNQVIFDITSDNFNANGDLAIQSGDQVFVIEKGLRGMFVNIRYRNFKFNHQYSIFKDLPEVETITFEDDNGMITYKMSDNLMAMYGIQYAE